MFRNTQFFHENESGGSHVIINGRKHTFVNISPIRKKFRKERRKEGKLVRREQNRSQAWDTRGISEDFGYLVGQAKVIRISYVYRGR